MHRKGMILTLATALSAAALGAQDISVGVVVPPPPPPPPPPGFGTFTYSAQAPVFEFIAQEPAMMGKVVTGAPYSAEKTTETTRVLADGTVIRNTDTSKIYRDGEGRVRDEATLKHIGFWVSDDKQPQTHITIMDPVAKQTIILNTGERTARVIPMPPQHGAISLDGRSAVRIQRAGPQHSVTITASDDQTLARKVQRDVETQVTVVTDGVNAAARTVEAGSTAMVAPRVMMFRGAANADNMKVEDLGEQTIQGVKATGKRRTTTIPTGAIGNDRPIVSVSEEWYSPDLQVVVQRTVKDPQAGETIYRLENVNLAEPLKSLFEIPSGYEVQETKPLLEKIQLERKSDG